MELLVATTNPHKAREFAQILGPLGVRVLSLADVSLQVPEPIEDAPTFAGNARIKAVAYATALGRLCLADDSGLEVDVLDGAPGVLSARYAGENGSREERDRRNREKLVRELRDLGRFDSPARLVCTLCLADHTGYILFEARGTLDGSFIEHARGGQGFGYDAHLLLPELGKTAAELSPKEMNARSHRGQATRELANWLSLWPRKVTGS
jgi:XTP/dITP diphosphohydrolase